MIYKTPDYDSCVRNRENIKPKRCVIKCKKIYVYRFRAQIRNYPVSNKLHYFSLHPLLWMQI